MRKLHETGIVLDMTTPSSVSLFAARLAFLSDFRDYHLYIAQNARETAAQKLVHLLSGTITPVGMWAILLVEAVLLLEGRSPGQII